MNTVLSLFPPPYILSKKYLLQLLGGDATAPSMTQIRIWKHGTAVAIALIFCCSCEHVHKFSQVLGFCTSAHGDWAENLTVEKTRSTAGPTSSLLECMYLVLSHRSIPLQGLVSLSVCGPTRPTSNESCTFSPSCALYCLCLLSSLSSVMVRKEYGKLPQ